MRPSVLKQTLRVSVENQVYVHIKGPPGQGKTQIPEQVANDLGYHKPKYPPYRLEHYEYEYTDDEGKTHTCVDTKVVRLPRHPLEPMPKFGFVHIHVPTCQPEDLALPQPTEMERLRFVIANWLPLEGDPNVPDFGMILLDELSQGSDEVQKTLANLVQAREAYGYKIKPGWSFVSTGNREEDRAGARRILSHLRDRSTVVELTQNLDDWCDWAIDSGIVPMVMVACVRFIPDLLCDFDPNREVNCTARGLVEKVGKMIGKYPPEAEFEMFKGAVGEGRAGQIVAFLTMWTKLQSPDAIILDPLNAKVPEEPDVLYATASSIAFRAREDNFERIMTYAKRLPTEFMTLVVRDSIRHALKNKEDLTTTKAFLDWAAKEGKDALTGR
jgi:hypothetical protein